MSTQIIDNKREIYFVSCPESNQVRAITMSYPDVPKEVKRRKDYRIWRQYLEEKELHPEFKLVDVVELENAPLIFNMYLDQFKCWNVPLYNFKRYEIENVFKVLIESKYQSNKFIINDLPYLDKHLTLMKDHFEMRYLSTYDNKLINELILLCGLNFHTSKFGWKKILSLKRIGLEPLLFNSPVGSYVGKDIILSSTEYLGRCADLLTFRYKEYPSAHAPIFEVIKGRPIEYILNALNSLFAYFRIELIFNKEVWENATDLARYLYNTRDHNRKFEVTQLYGKIMKDKSNHVKPHELTAMSNKVESIISENQPYINS